MRTIHYTFLFTFTVLFILSCASEEIKEEINTKRPPEVTKTSCTLTLLDGECLGYSNRLNSCSMGICKEGDCSTGMGKKEFPGGSIHEGNFKNGFLNGEGTISECGVKNFTGLVKDGIPEKGTFTFEDSSTYTGVIKKDLFEGKGVYKTASGDEYDGTWKTGKKNGKFNITIGGEKSSITYQDDEDVREIARRKKRNRKKEGV